MKNLIVNNCFNLINKHKELDHYNEVKIKYGLEVLYHFVSKVTILLLISYFLGILKNILIIMALFLPLKLYSHGAHARTNIGCWISSITIYSFIGIYSKTFQINPLIYISSGFISILSFLLWSPADTENRPLPNKDIRKKLKNKSTFILIIEIVIGVIFKNLRIYVFIVSITQSLLINPALYKLFGLHYNNYQYIRKE